MSEAKNFIQSLKDGIKIIDFDEWMYCMNDYKYKGMNKLNTLIPFKKCYENVMGI